MLDKFHICILKKFASRKFPFLKRQFDDVNIKMIKDGSRFLIQNYNINFHNDTNEKCINAF